MFFIFLSAHWEKTLRAGAPVSMLEQIIGLTNLDSLLMSVDCLIETQNTSERGRTKSH